MVGVIRSESSRNMDLVSIIIPAFNAELFVRETIESALAQTYPNCEVIVVNDGSTDNTEAILAEYAGKIRVVLQANKGSASACNAGVAAANGKWVCFLDADDIWLPCKVENQINACAQYVISHTDSICFGEAIPAEVRRSSFEPAYSGLVLAELLIVNFISKSTVMMLREIFDQFGGFDESYVTVEDWPFWLRVCAEYELGYLAQPVVRYRVHQKSKSMLSHRTHIARLRVIEEAFGRGGVGEKLPQLRNRALASAYQVGCHFAAGTGNWKFALKCALNALRYSPNSNRTWKNLAKTALLPLGVKY